MSDIVVISPHLDDAVLSIGGLIGREVAAGNRVDVWTCFTSGPPLDSIPKERRVFGDYTSRRDEETRALAVLGAGHRWLDLHERIWRNPPPARTLHVFHTPPREDDFTELPKIREAVRTLLDGTAQIYAPLAIGHHVDHTEVTLAVLRELLARDAFDRIKFYEDPYALGGACRRQHFVASRRLWPMFGAPAWSSPRVGGLLRVVAMSARGPRVEDYIPEAAKLDWTCSPNPISEADETRKLAAIAEYGSQVTVFGGLANVKRFMNRGHRMLGGEPLWSCRR
jgi:LmbE family N-acetylglucosaminyl deacetylase